jgi:mRNA interferase RelE/StbE
MRQVRFAPEASDQLERLDKPTAQHVLKKIRWMTGRFDQATHLPLTGNLKGVFKLRVGDYRVLYTFDESEIVVHVVKHRSEIYKSK